VGVKVGVANFLGQSIGIDENNTFQSQPIGFDENNTFRDNRQVLMRTIHFS